MKSRFGLVLAVLLGLGMVVLIGGLFATAGFAQGIWGGDQTLAVSNQVGGIVGGVAQAGDYAYAGYGSSIHILNVQNPASPVLVAKTQPLPGVISDLALNGNLLVAGAGQSVVVLDVSDPAAPAVLGVHEVTGVAIRLVISGNLVYVAEAQYFNEVQNVGGGLRIINIGDPVNPSEVSYLNTNGGTYDVDVSGNYAYIGGRFSNVNQLWVVDVSNPNTPMMVTSRNEPTLPRGIITDGSYLYVAVINFGVDVYDISNLASPTYVTNVDTPGSAWALDLKGDTLYVSDAAGGMHYVDVSNPNTPSIQDTYFVDGTQTINVVAGDTHTYIAYGGAGVRITPLNNSNLVGFYEQAIGAADIIAINGDRAMVLEEFRGVHILDIGDGNNPAKIGFYTTTGFYNRMQLVGDTGYLLGGTTGLTRIDLSMPSTPTFIDNYLSGGTKNSFAVRGNYAYIGRSTLGVEIVDLSTSPPTYVSELNFSGGAREISLVGDYAFVASGNLYIVDISSPMTPTLVTNFPIAGSAYTVDVSGQYAYVGVFESGLHVVDVSNPNVPVAVAFFPINLDFEEMTTAGEFVYVAGGEQKDAAVIDVTNPLAPSLFGRYPTSGPFNRTESVAIRGEHFYAASWLAGLYVLASPAVLQAANDGPTVLGQATIFTATIFVTETVTFNWDFGDGMNGSGANPSHVYGAPGVYTATVMAQYGASSQTAETVVIVEEAISGLTASNDGPTLLGEVTTLMATITAGTDVSYAWDFGDGNTGSGAVVMHTYGAEGMYTAVVTATNLVSGETAMTTVVVELTDYEVYMPAVVGKPD